MAEPSAPPPSNLKELHLTGAQEKIETISEEMRSRAGRIASDVGERIVHSYDEATEWISQNYGRVLMIAGAIGAAGLIGYALIRKRRSTTSSSESEPLFDMGFEAG